MLVTPHTAFLTVEALDNIAATTIENLDQVGRELRTPGRGLGASEHAARGQPPSHVPCALRGALRASRCELTLPNQPGQHLLGASPDPTPLPSAPPPPPPQYLLNQPLTNEVLPMP